MYNILKSRGSDPSRSIVRKGQFLPCGSGAGGRGPPFFPLIRPELPSEHAPHSPWTNR